MTKRPETKQHRRYSVDEHQTRRDALVGIAATIVVVALLLFGIVVLLSR